MHSIGESVGSMVWCAAAGNGRRGHCRTARIRDEDGGESLGRWAGLSWSRAVGDVICLVIPDVSEFWRPWTRWTRRKSNHALKYGLDTPVHPPVHPPPSQSSSIEAEVSHILARVDHSLIGGDVSL